MRKQSSECKDNNAACVKVMMPNRSPAALLRRAVLWPATCAMAGPGRQKQLDTSSDGSIIIFTDLAESFEATHGRQRCQVRGTATTGDPKQVHDELFLQDDFFDPRDLVQVKYEMLRRVQAEGQSVTDASANFGFSRPSFYQALSAFEQDGLSGLVPHKRGPKQAHKLTHEVLTFIGEVRQKEPSVRLPDLVKQIQERFGIRVHPRSIERSLLRHQKKLR